jgi:GNAT superfamily N-acetyltransferase
VTNVYTVPLYRRQKIARRMMETLARVAAQHGAIAVMLTDTIDSQRLYNRMGFAPNHMLELKLDRYRTEESDG